MKKVKETEPTQKERLSIMDNRMINQDITRSIAEQLNNEAYRPGKAVAHVG